MRIQLLIQVLKATPDLKNDIRPKNVLDKYDNKAEHDNYKLENIDKK